MLNEYLINNILSVLPLFSLLIIGNYTFDMNKKLGYFFIFGKFKMY